MPWGVAAYAAMTAVTACANNIQMARQQFGDSRDGVKPSAQRYAPEVTLTGESARPPRKRSPPKGRDNQESPGTRSPLKRGLRLHIQRLTNWIRWG